MANGVEFELNFADEIQRASAIIQSTPEQLNKAANRAMKKTTRWMQSGVLRESARLLNVPTSILKKRLTVTAKGKGSHAVHIVWFGVAHLSVEKLKPSQNRAGVRAGKHQFRGAFIRNVYGDGKRAWIRKSRAESLGVNVPHLNRRNADDGRFPLLPLSIDIGDASKIFHRYQARAYERFQTIMQQELNFAVNIEGRR